MSKVRAFYHIVFCTKGREMTIPLEHTEHLYRFIWKTIGEMNCQLIRIGGIQNHLHLLIELHQTVALASLVQNIKRLSSRWLAADPRFPLYSGWSAEYYACTVSPEHKQQVIEYIIGQVSHHWGNRFDDELKDMCQYAGLPYDERDMQ